MAGIDLNKPDAHARELHAFTLNGNSFKLTAHSFKWGYKPQLYDKCNEVTAQMKSVHAHYERNIINLTCLWYTQEQDGII